jgi:hypothetical protein
MVSGRLKCIGSANHLRQRYGHGYQLDVNVPVDRVNQMKAFIIDHFPGSQVLEHHDSNIKFRIRKGDRSLGGIFRILNDNRSILGISEYSVSEATLEQIFIRFARQQEEETAQAEGMTDTTLLQLDDDLPHANPPTPGHAMGRRDDRKHDEEASMLHAQAVVPTYSNGHVNGHTNGHINDHHDLPVVGGEVELGVPAVYEHKPDIAAVSLSDSEIAH